MPELTRVRSMASVPFGGRYRLIDFTLSNMVNSGINNIGLVTHQNYQSLLDHIGTGKDWDLARRSGGIRMIPPYISAYENPALHKMYISRLEAMLSAASFIRHCPEDTIVISDCDVVCNIDIAALVDEHKKSGAQVTFLAKTMDVTEGQMDPIDFVLESDETGRITHFTHYKPGTTGKMNVFAQVMVMDTAFLRSIVDEATAQGFTSFYHDIIRPNADKLHLHAVYTDSWFAQMHSMEQYFRYSMELLNSDVRADLFKRENLPIQTKVRNSPPTRYLPGAKVSGSLIADGCVIEGTVENSIIFRGVHVGRGAVIRNSILMQGTYVGDHASLQCVVTDKNVLIGNGRTLSGHQSMPFYIAKGTHI
jgi:glucose-1-phosphate adenylyltransferase